MIDIRDERVKAEQSIEKYLLELFELRSSDGTRLGDPIAGSRLYRGFCGHCGEPIRISSYPNRFKSLRQKIETFRERRRRFLEEKKGRAPALSPRVLAAAFVLRNQHCNYCGDTAFFWRQQAQKSPHTREKLEAIIDEDSD